MAALITRLFIFFPCIFVPLFAQNLLSCNDDSHEIQSDYVTCKNPAKNASENQCTTFAVLHTNPYYSSLFNLSLYLGLNRVTIAEANGFSPDTEFLPRDQPLLIPIECKCSAAEFFQAELVRITTSGETFDGIVESLEGLTTCRGIREKNPGLVPGNLPEKTKVSVPLRCACPSSSQISSGTKLLVSYPVSSGDTFRSVAAKFHVNNKSERELILNSLPILIPLSQKPLLGSLAKPSEPSLGFAEKSVRASERQQKKSKMQRLTVCIAVVSVVAAVGVLAAATFFIFQWKRKRQSSLSAKMADAELQQLNLSIRTSSEKKVSFEGSQSTLDGQTMDPATPRRQLMLESYTLGDLRKATEDFNSENLIEGSVYHGLLKGENLAIKCTTPDFISKVEFTFFHDAIHNHPNIMRVLGSCLTDGPHSYLVFEYAKNGSLKDWIHGGLAMKSHFIASCCCFLTWAQRLRICRDVASALQYMHHIMHPVYVHRNIKSRNIFLDEEFNAKVGNFGMAKCDENDPNQDTEFNLRNPSSWSKGYLAPEHLKEGTISPSIDIFDYGVVLLEILSGKRPVICSDEKGGEVVMLSDRIKAILESDDSDEQLRRWMDVDLGENYPFDDAVTLANLARSCIDDDPLMRPSAGEIVEKLSRLVENTPEGDQQFLVCESSYKPLVRAAASNNMY
ncbi:hypothetical protein Cgig2_020794 [Carnegiea gigantea]|uniref:Protein kinase domain-containing protein n=1 Tax=Carnegiea gigantea TaxID=171969 RepID=A0A9Q1KIG0_9CARY|nr:hypothetical protein Cgig2_020794 [Carnegiea gigantea]